MCRSCRVAHGEHPDVAYRGLKIDAQPSNEEVATDALVVDECVYTRHSVFTFAAQTLKSQPNHSRIVRLPLPDLIFGVDAAAVMRPSESVVQQLVLPMRNLQRLSLRTDALTPESASCIARCCPRIRHVQLRGAPAAGYRANYCTAEEDAAEIRVSVLGVFFTGVATRLAPSAGADVQPLEPAPPLRELCSLDIPADQMMFAELHDRQQTSLALPAITDLTIRGARLPASLEGVMRLSLVGRGLHRQLLDRLALPASLRELSIVGNPDALVQLPGPRLAIPAPAVSPGAARWDSSNLGFLLSGPAASMLRCLALDLNGGASDPFGAVPGQVAVSDWHVAAITAACPRLESLQLLRCRYLATNSGISDRVADALTATQLPRLRYLKLSGTDITVKGFERLCVESAASVISLPMSRDLTLPKDADTPGAARVFAGLHTFYPPKFGQDDFLWYRHRADSANTA